MLVPQGLCIVLVFQSESEHGPGLPTMYARYVDCSKTLNLR